MDSWGGIFAAVDATGAGAAVVREDGTLGESSEGFCELLGFSTPPLGSDLHALLPELPAFEGLPSRLGPQSPAVVHGSVGRRRRILAVARLELEGQRCLIVADRSSEQRSRAELRTGPVERAARPGESQVPRASRVRPMSEMGERCAHALALARRYGHRVTVIRLELEVSEGVDLDGIVLGCVRGVDDVGRTEPGRYLLLLPDTELGGAKVVCRRIQGKLQGFGTPSLGLAQSLASDDAAALLEAAQRACLQAKARGGGLVSAHDSGLRADPGSLSA